MKYLGTIKDPKDLITKEYADDKVSGVQTSLTELTARVSTNEDNLDAILNKVGNTESYIIKSLSIPTTAWVANTNTQVNQQEKEDYPFMATISITNPSIKESDIARVVFRYAEQANGNFSQNCFTTTNGVIIEAIDKPTITITLDYILIERIL